MKALWTSVLACMLLAGCGASNPVKPADPAPTEDWTYPVVPGKSAIALYCPDSLVAIGSSFDVKVVLYGARTVFGAVVEVEFDPSRAEVVEVLAGPALRPTGNELSASHVGPAGHATFASTRRQGDAVPDTTTGAICKLRCRALAAGTASFKIVPNALSLTTASGADIPNRGALRREDISIRLR